MPCDETSNDQKHVDLEAQLWNTCAVVSTKCYRAYNLNAQFMSLYDEESLRAEVKVLYKLFNTRNHND